MSEPGLPLQQYLRGYITIGTMCSGCGEYWPFEQQVCTTCQEYKSLAPAIELRCGHVVWEHDWRASRTCDTCVDLFNWPAP